MNRNWIVQRATIKRGFAAILSLFIVITSCDAPPIRKNSSGDRYIQGTLATYLDLLIVIDSSRSFTQHRRILRNSMNAVIQSLVDSQARFRIGITSGSARAFSVPPRNQVQQLIQERGFSDGSPAFGLDGTFTTSGTNSDFIRDNHNPVQRFSHSIDKINLLTNLLIGQNIAYFNQISWPLADFSAYYSSNYFNVNLDSIPGPVYNYIPGPSSDAILRADDERYLEAIKMANDKVNGIFPAEADLNVNAIPLAIMIVKDATPDQSSMTEAHAKNMLRSLRQITINGIPRPNLKLFGLLQDTSGNIAQIIHQLDSENNGVSGRVFPLTASPSTVASAVSAVRASLEEPQSLFCLHQTPNLDQLVVTLDGAPQVIDVDFVYHSDANCIEFFEVPVQGQEILIRY